MFAALAANATHAKKAIVRSPSQRERTPSAPVDRRARRPTRIGAGRCSARRASAAASPRRRRTHRPWSPPAAHRPPCARPPLRRSAHRRSSQSPRTPRCRGRARCSNRTQQRSTPPAAAFAPTQSSRARTRAPGRTVEISPLLAELVASGCARTTRARDASIRHLDRSSRAAGYDRTFALVRERDTWTFRPRARPRLTAARRAARHRAAHVACAGRSRARSRSHGQGMVRRPDGRADRALDADGRTRLTRRRHRGRRRAAADGLADAHRRRPRHAPRRPRPGRRNRRGRPRDIEHDRSALAHRPRRGTPHPRPGDGRARADTVAIRQRGCDQLRRRERRRHGRDRPRRSGAGLARGASLSRPALCASTAHGRVPRAGRTTAEAA